MCCVGAAEMFSRCVFDKNIWANFVEKAVAFHRTIKLGPEPEYVTSEAMGIYRSLASGALAWGLR